MEQIAVAESVAAQKFVGSEGNLKLQNIEGRNFMELGKKKEEIAMRVSKVSIIINLLLSAFKLVAGIVAASGAMISDAVHSASDVFSTFIVIIGIRISGKRSDKEHPYGHERMECVAALVLAVILAATGVGIGAGGIGKIVGGNYGDLEVPRTIALVAAVVSIVVKEWMYWYTRGAAKQINSGALMADAWHHRSDSLSSIGAFVGILGARMGYPVLDPVASVVICIFILKAAWDVFRDAIEKMVDRSCDEETQAKIRHIAEIQDGVRSVDSLQTRLFGNRIYVDLEIACDGDRTLNETHRTAELVHDEIERNLDQIKHIMVHVNPAGKELKEQISETNAQQENPML